MNKITVGIDISKKKFDVCVLFPNEKVSNRTFSNDPKGFTSLLNWLDQKKAGFCRIAMEATGAYGEDLAHALYDKGHTVFIINPAQIKYFGKSRLSRSKTDKKDARLIADFTVMHPELRSWTPPSASQAKMKCLYRHLVSLKKNHAQLMNQLESSRDTDVKKHILTHLAFVEKQITKVQEKLRSMIEADPDVKGNLTLLQSIPGVGEMVSWGILLEVPDIKNFRNAKQLAAFVGLNPTTHESGSSVRGRGAISKTGSASLRSLLYMPSMSAMRHNSVIKSFAERLRTKGKNGKKIVVACMRKLLHIIYGVLSKQRSFVG